MFDTLLRDFISSKLDAKFGPAATGIAQSLLVQMGKNAQDPEKAKALYDTLDRHSDETIENVDDVQSGKILGHIYESDLTSQKETLAKQYNINPDEAEGIMKKMAPALLGMMGQSKKSQSLDLSAILQAFGNTTQKATSNTESNITNMATKMLDRDGDGKIMDDVVAHFDKNKNGILDEVIAFAKKLLGRK